MVKVYRLELRSVQFILKANPMHSWPIHIPVRTTRSKDIRKQQTVQNLNRTAAILERFINEKFESEPSDSVLQFFHQTLARELGVDAETVRRCLESVSGGSNGITILKGDLDRAGARAFRHS